MLLYLGEADGARILRYGVGIAQVGDDYQLEAETWELIPAGEMGDCVFRSVGVSFEYTNGYHIGITPIVDGVELPESTFTGSGSGIDGQAQAFVRHRGTQLAVRVRTLSRTGDLRLMNIQVSYSPLRQWP